ncbi:TetR/AcrR family transcriptional regulator [Sphingobacterium phlebotomi]|uniref:TetR/AcrR family transcriptional regulator n=1 Tax=Sphingobacterium phlebotomi TaxID=2605433 RepID=A0A5D4HA04_9SPHI|nr:TetR/AcrR family transcriptional regulator [Sphingobacterium phlebotomi]TYR37468.1 TetR/AcrR family transcriptional regulator [Sphingobacterium phlebotomi]
MVTILREQLTNQVKHRCFPFVGMFDCSNEWEFTMEELKAGNRKTKDRLIDAVRSIVRNDGYKALKPSKVAQVADVDKKLIYYYFKDIDGLIEAYHEREDRWIRFGKQIKDAVENSKITSTENILGFYLRKQFEQLSECLVHGKIMEYEMSENTYAVENLYDERENHLEELFFLLKHSIAVSESRYRAVFAILIGGINYLAMLSGSDGKKICGFDLSKEYDRAEISSALKYINSLLFDGEEQEEESVDQVDKKLKIS